MFCGELLAESYQRVGLLPEPPDGKPSNGCWPQHFVEELALQDGYALEGLEAVLLG